MDQELISEIVTEFPNIYIYANPQGIKIDNGWYDMLCDLSAKLKSIVEPNQSPFVVRVREKYGGLRVYIQQLRIPSANILDQVTSAILKAEQKSYFICEKCGSDGILRDLPWKKTLCSKDAAEARAALVILTV